MNIIEKFNKGQKKYKVLIWSNYYITIHDTTIITKGVESEWLIGIYEFIANPKYKVIETLSMDKKIREDFWKMMEEYTFTKRVHKDFTKQMLKGYWEEYIIEVLNGKS